MSPTVEEERALAADGHQWIAGVDEVGRGCWAGPVVAAAVVFDAATLAEPQRLAGVNDSKQLTAAQREGLCALVLQHAAGWGIGSAPAHIVDTHGIVAATRLAMQVAILRLPQPPDALLIDAVTLDGWPCTQRSLIKGDARSLSIAAASILAKVARDRMMRDLGRCYPQYGFGAHKGYGTAAHARALHTHGPLEQHRRTFQPLAYYLTHGEWPAD